MFAILSPVATGAMKATQNAGAAMHSIAAAASAAFVGSTDMWGTQSKGSGGCGWPSIRAF